MPMDSVRNLQQKGLIAKALRARQIVKDFFHQLLVLLAACYDAAEFFRVHRADHQQHIHKFWMEVPDAIIARAQSNQHFFDKMRSKFHSEEVPFKLGHMVCSSVEFSQMYPHTVLSYHVCNARCNSFQCNVRSRVLCKSDVPVNAWFLVVSFQSKSYLSDSCGRSGRHQARLGRTRASPLLPSRSLNPKSSNGRP